MTSEINNLAYPYDTVVYIETTFPDHQVFTGSGVMVGPNDVLTLSAVSAVLGVVAAIACLLPALRATRVSPGVALRAE